ncbi:MAG: hypothetical protein A2283_01655 [Lentisphaerae bacterium RIFOXYA12_FULL_48_11]|nr:MAG: hypothetical protein A2283_01655 [Lentisphaerae bacterium RIFOXYA12_FULL_48_11]
MKLRELIKWAILAYLITLAMLIYTLYMLPASPDNVLANFAKFMITQFYPLFAIAPILAVYSICVRRWQPILGGLVGNIVFFPLTLILMIFLSFVVGGPISAWQEGWHVVAVTLVIAYLTLATLVTKRWIIKRRSQQSSGGDVANRAAPQQ